MCIGRSLQIACALLLAWIFGSNADGQQTQPKPATQVVIRRDVEIPPARMTYVNESITKLFQKYIRGTPINVSMFEMEFKSGLISLEFRTAENKVRLVGPEALANDIGTLISTFALHRPEEAVKILPLHDNGQASLSKFSLLAGSSSTNPMRLASAQQAVATPPAIPAKQDPPPSKQDGGVGQSSLPLPQFEGVQIEMLPEIDAIILRGRDQQLTDLAEIIKRLDDASRLTRPEMEVIPLQHTGSNSIAKLIAATQEKLVATTQGRVSVTPLGKPNSLLLIGWGEALSTTKELISKLDQPVSPDAQFEVIQLKHAIATELQTSLQSFFRNREGLAPIIQSMVDNRTNAIVVHAPPRDLLEIRRLVTQLDVPRGTLMQHAKVFPLRNSPSS